MAEPQPGGVRRLEPFHFRQEIKMRVDCIDFGSFFSADPGRLKKGTHKQVSMRMSAIRFGSLQ